MLKLAFLFLTIGNIYHETYWQDFLREHQNAYSLYVHAKNGVTQDFFRPYALATTVPTTWANTMRAEQQLIREALKDPENQYFILISEADIPLQDFDTIYNVLMQANKSIFEWWPSPDTQVNNPRNIKELAPENQYKNNTWIILNRQHAEIVAHDTVLIDAMSRYPIDCEHYPSTLLAFHHELEKNVINATGTFADWQRHSRDGHHPYTFKDLRAENNTELLQHCIKNGYFFARKFTKDCDLSPLDPYLAYRNPHRTPKAGGN